MKATRILGIAISSRRTAFVCIEDGQLLDWGKFCHNRSSSADLMGRLETLISRLRPDVVVTEKLGSQCRKGAHVQGLINSINAIAHQKVRSCVSQSKPKLHRSKYEEAISLAEWYPEMQAYCPETKRLNGQSEPRSIILFEALVLADAVYVSQE